MVDDQYITFVTGSSGYVASSLIPILKEYFPVIGMDERAHIYTDVVCDIVNANDYVELFEGRSVIVVNLAAARFDFGVEAAEYFTKNVSCHRKLLENLSSLNIEKFIHVSSVAAIDGRNITYSDDLGCDDAYRSTKYLQEKLVRDWCRTRGVELTVLYPSAIFAGGHRSDTNIGMLQLMSKFLPVIPSIKVTKSLTYLPNFVKFISDAARNKFPSGNYLAIETPSLSVSRMIQLISGHPKPVVFIPFFSVALKLAAYTLYALGGFGRVDLKLTPNRVVKLFSDTSYCNISVEEIDSERYAARHPEALADILANLHGTTPNSTDN